MTIDRAVRKGTACVAVVVSVVVLVVSGCSSGENPDLTPEITATVSNTELSAEPAGPAPQQAWVLSAEFGDGQVLVGGTGPADTNASVAMCLDQIRTGGDYLMCDMPEAVMITTDADGTFAATLSGSPYIGVGIRREADCRDETCAVAVLGVGDGPDSGTEPWDVLGVQDKAITWPDSLVLGEGPLLQLGDLSLDAGSNTGTVQVHGSGFTPQSEISLVQCPASDDDGVSAGDCLYEYGTLAVADDQGEFDVPLTVYPLFQRSDGKDVECDCSTATICYVRDPWPEPGSGNRYIMVPLSEAATPAG